MARNRAFSAVFALAVLAVVFPPSLSIAQQHSAPMGVVELFTSQGCSSCPPADDVLARLAERGDVLALAYHVDYWNYLGWNDTLSAPEHTARQYGYARLLERKSVYTPQAVINGRDHVNGSDRSGIDRLLSRFVDEGRGLTIDLALRREDDMLIVDVGPGIGKADIVLAVFDKKTTVDIDRGENGGRSISYANAVRSLQMVGVWKGEALHLELPDTVVDDWSAQNSAVFLQTMHDKNVPGPIIGAAVLR